MNGRTAKWLRREAVVLDTAAGRLRYDRPYTSSVYGTVHLGRCLHRTYRGLKREYLRGRRYGRRRRSADR